MWLLRSPESGSLFWLRMKCGNLIASRMKKMGVLLPTTSKLP
jgi:hypothetical protein